VLPSELGWVARRSLVSCGTRRSRTRLASLERLRHLIGSSAQALLQARSRHARIRLVQESNQGAALLIPSRPG
jgi:hypothetical protein